jgi:hypothetical protein
MNDTDDKKAAASEPRGWWLLAILTVVVAMWGANWWLLNGNANRGTFGDMFGGINALFSGAAFSVLAYTLLLQRYELKLQRQELAETRKVMESQREQMELQAKTQQLQQFENTFFQLIKGHNEIVQNMAVGYRRRIQGRASFPTLIDTLREQYRALAAEESERINFGLNALYEEYETELGHYFRHLYHILKFIDQHKEVDRLRYRSFLRAQLSAEEFVLLFYNCLGPRGEKCKPLVEKYGMLKHLQPTSLFNIEHANYFEKRAFLPTEGPLG